MKKTSLEDVLILNGIKLARFWVRITPPALSYAFARRVGALVYWAGGKRRDDAYKNLRMAFASEKEPRELRRIARRSIQNLAMGVVDTLRIPEITEKDFRAAGHEHAQPFVRDKKGILFLTGHFGSWELLNIGGRFIGYPMTVLARAQKHPRADAYLNELRRSKGNQVIHKGMPLREILRALKEGKIVGILSDQDGGRNGCFVEFMGRLSSTPPGAAVFSLRTGVPILPAFIRREAGNRHFIEIGKPLRQPPADWTEERAQKALLQQFAHSLEAKIRETPDQWLWAHRRWKSSPDKQVLVLSDGKAGHVNQSLAVLEAIRRERRSHHLFEERVFSNLVEVHFRNGFAQKAVRALSLLFGGHLPFRRFWMRLALTPECYRALLHTYADIVVSCGSSLVDVNLWMKKENLARSVVVMKPAFPFVHFDAVIAPKHDGLAEHPRLFSTEGALSALTVEDLELEAGVLAAELGLASGRRRIGVLIGGNTGNLYFEKAIFEGLMRSLHEAALHSRTQLLITTSRRTPAWADAFLKELFSDRTLCPLLLIANEANRSGIVAGILGLSDAVVVTAESMSMIAETANAGKPAVVIRPWSGKTLKPKYEEYLNRLTEEGRAVASDVFGLEAGLEKALGAAEPAGASYRSREEAVLGAVVRRIS